MKKNFIAAFADKKTKLDKVTGGHYYQDTITGGGSQYNDEQLVTERGETAPDGTVNHSSEVYDSAVVMCSPIAPLP